MIQKLYHNVLNIDRLKLILDSGCIIKDSNIKYPCVYMTRSKNYLNHRGIRMIFDYNKLKYNYKVKPFCYSGYSQIHKLKFNPGVDEMEERVYNNVDINKCCIRIDVDKNKYPSLNFNHILINLTYNF